MIQVTRQGTESSSSAEALEKLRAQFERQHYFLLPGLLEPGLLALIQRQIDRGEFRERVHERIDSNKELCLTANAGVGALLFLMNDETLFRIIQDVTRCDRIRSFEGRVYRVNPGAGHHDAWHNDIGEDRLVGMSINLSREVYSGGVLQIRERESEEVVSEAVNTGAGDAVIFRLAREFQHRITEVEGSNSKSAFAGWFRAQPDSLSLLKESYEERDERHLDKISLPSRVRSSGPIHADLSH